MGTMREVWRWFSSSSSFRSIMLITMWEVWRWFSSSFSLGSIMLGTMWEVWRWFSSSFSLGSIIMLGTMWEVWRWFSSTWTWFSSSFSFIFGAIMLTYAMYKQYFPNELKQHIRIHWNRFLLCFKHNIKISVHQYSPRDSWKLSEAYTAIETYLGTKSATRAKRLKAKLGKNSKDLVFSMDDYEEITDVHQGVVLTWSAIKSSPNGQHSDSDDEWYFEVEFHRKHRNFVMETYMSYAIEQGKAIAFRSREMKLYGNRPTTSGQKWGCVVFDHPARFEKLAMDPVKKQEIMDDLVTFSKAKDYYAKVGKIWKRGYLLYGPPGTGKSTMVAAIANFLNYDIYDLELTAVKKNSELRQLLIGTNNKSIIVIEDIDCSLDLTGQRKNVKNDDDDDKKKNPNLKKDKKEDDSSKKESEVTLSGLLNFIDGLWSACGTERIIIFTTNYIEKLDPALIRKGRMDKHIELAYCEFEGFKVLAKNYLDIDSHPLFDTIRELMEETSMTPADVAENLIPKTVGIDASTCLESLIQALQNAKEESKLKKKAEEEATHLKKKKKEAKEEEKLKKNAKEEATNLKKKKKKKAEEEAADLKKKNNNNNNKKKPEEKTRLKEASKVEEGDDKPNKDEEEQNELLVKQQQHIELSYCGFEGFKVLTKNHLQIVLHDLFETIRGLIEETQMSPADVAQHLIPKTVGMDSEHCLKSLIQALEMSKKKQC